MNNEERKRIMDEVRRFSEPRPPRDDEFTVAAFRDTYGFTHKQAYDRLEGLRREGTLERRRAIVSGNTCYVYRLSNEQ